MTYWNEKSDSHIRFWNVELYQSYYRLKDQINSEGYRSDMLQPSEVVYLGSCDVMSSIPHGELRWVNLVYRNIHPEQPHIVLGTVGSGLPTMVRRLYSYIQNFGAPKHVYMTVPRFDGYEYVNKSGNCYNVSSRIGSAKFCQKTGLINDDELDTWLLQLESNKRLRNIHNNQYILEERFAFLETICKLHNIQMHWTFNPSDAAILTLHENISLFENISPFMKNSFVGLPQVRDHLVDRTIGIETHKAIYEQFSSSEDWDYEKLCEQSKKNFDWANEKYGRDIIKFENNY